MSPKPLAVSMGDPAGIGPELALAVARLSDPSNSRPVVLYADPRMLRERAESLSIRVQVVEVTRPADATALPAGALAVLPVRLAEPSIAGRPCVGNAPAVIAAIEAATRAVAEGETDALVTLPIAKETVQAAGFAHPGHTEFLAELAARHWPGLAGRVPKPVMLLASDELRVVPLTVHVALERVAGMISGEAIIETVRIMVAALRGDFAIGEPRIAVAGLNPHAGEGGTMGRQEVETIAPAIALLRAEGLAVSGPHSADTLFHARARAGYDAVLAMYHDQALIPSKTLAFDEGVNVTLGLPFVRTSPDHGTAFDIAGKGIARPDSYLAALRLAAEMADRRAASRGVS